MDSRNSSSSRPSYWEDAQSSCPSWDLMAVGQMVNGAGCHNLLAAHCKCMQCGQDLSANSYERRVAHVKKCKPGLGTAQNAHAMHHSVQPYSAGCSEHFWFLYHSYASLSNWSSHPSCPQTVWVDAAGADQTKHRADSKGHSRDSKAAASADMHYLPGWEIPAGTDSGNSSGYD